MTRHVLTRDTAFRLSAGEPLSLSASHDLPDAQRRRSRAR